MTKPPASPLASIVAAAKRNLPENTGATARAAARAARGEIRIVLADVSASMAESAGALTKAQVLDGALRQLPSATSLVAFSSYPVDIPAGGSLPPPSGSTALHTAIRHSAAREPTHVLIISDGHPDDAPAALREADRLGSVRIDVIFCGPDSDREGLAFMRRLARGGGSVHHHNIRREPERLAQAVRALALPAR